MSPATAITPPPKLEFESKITSKGQITLPVEIRRRPGVKEGESVKFVVQDDGRTVVLPVRDEENPFLKYVGALGVFKTRQEILDWVSEMRDDDERKADLAEWREIEKQEALQRDENRDR
jgi:antitoxin PrlF